MRDKYYINDEYLKNTDMKMLLKVMMEYLVKKATQFQTEFQITSRKKEIAKENTKDLINNYLDSKIPDLVMYDKTGSLFESYSYGKKFTMYLTKEEFADFQKMLVKNKIPEKIFFSENDAEILRKRAFGLITVQNIKKDKK